MAMVGLPLKEIYFSKPMDKQENKFSKHKSAQQTMLRKKDTIINYLIYLNILIIIPTRRLVWCPGQNKKIAPLFPPWMCERMKEEIILLLIMD
jgi:hypothetical protein